MLPNFSRLSLKSTGNFYALTKAEAAKLKADGVYDSITYEDFKPNQDRNSEQATFRVRVDLPNNKSIHKFFIAKGLWGWVRKPAPETKPAIAVMPDTRKPVWREDWWALSDRFAPGALYPRWVRNLPLRDESTSDSMDRYETLRGLSLSGLGNLEASEGASLMADSNAFFASADAYLVPKPTFAATNALRESIETLLRGVHSLDYESEIDLPSHESTADGIGQRLIAILQRPDPAVWGRPASALLKGYALALLAKFAHGDIIRKLIRANMDFPASLRAHGVAVLGNENFDWGVERGSPDWCAQHYSARIRTFRAALHQVLHAYYWNRRVEDRMLEAPPSVERLEEEAARPLNDAEREVLSEIEALQVAMEDQWRELQQITMAQFFSQTDGRGRAYMKKLKLTGELFKKTLDYPNEGTVRHLARNQFLFVMNAITELNDDPTWRNANQEEEAKQLFVACVMSLGPAVAAVQMRGSSPWTNQQGLVYRERMEEFFWRIVKRAYEGVAAQHPGLYLQEVENILYDQLLVNWPAEGEEDSEWQLSDNDDDETEEEENEEEEEKEEEEENDEEEEDCEPNPHDAPLPRHLRRLLEPTDEAMSQPSARRQRR